MSEELKVLVECDHRVTDERLFIDTRDYQTIRFPYPIANSDIQIRLNGYLIQPTNPTYGFSSTTPEGKVVINIFSDETSVEPKLQKLLFNFPLPSDSIVEVSYTSPLAYCRKCFGTSLVYDYQVNFDGTGFTKVSGLTKLRQDCLKAILTVRESNIFHPWAGTSIESLIGEKYNDVILFDLKREIGSVLSNLRKMQLKQASYQTVSPDETIQSIDNIYVAISSADPTILLIQVDITSASGQSVAVSQAFKSTGSITGLLNA